MDNIKQARIALDLALTIWNGESASGNDLNDVYSLIEQAHNNLKEVN